MEKSANISKNDTIAVLITVHNRKKTTLECLHNLYSQNTGSYTLDVFLVDDASTDGTGDAVRAQYPDVNLILGDGNLFWNRGMRKAWEIALRRPHDFFLWLNDDTIIYENAINNILEDYHHLPPKSIISGATCASFDNTKVTYGGNTDKMLSPNGIPQHIDYMNGNFVLIPNIVCQVVGINDAKFTHSYGDREYSVRCNKNGIGVYLASHFIGICDVHEKVKKCYDPNYGLFERLKNLISPLGNPPSELFYMYYRESGLYIAIKYVLANLLCAIFPKTAKRLNKIPV